MRETYKSAVTLALSLLVGLVLVAALGVDAGLAQSAGQPRPNIVFVLTDDQMPGTENRMPALQNNLVRQGVTFSNMTSTFPLCCPGTGDPPPRAVPPQHPDLRQLAPGRGVGEVQGQGTA